MAALARTNSRGFSGRPNGGSTRMKSMPIGASRKIGEGEGDGEEEAVAHVPGHGLHVHAGAVPHLGHVVGAGLGRMSRGRVALMGGRRSCGMLEVRPGVHDLLMRDADVTRHDLAAAVEAAIPHRLFQFDLADQGFVISDRRGRRAEVGGGFQHALQAPQVLLDHQ